MRTRVTNAPRAWEFLKHYDAATIADLAAARKRNARRLRGSVEAMATPYNDRIEQWMPIHYIVLNRAGLLYLLAHKRLDIGKAHPSMSAWGQNCPWGEPGDYRWIHEPVILHPRLGPVFSNNLNWPEFARNHPQERSMPIQLRRFFVKIVLIKRTRKRWDLTLILGDRLPVPWGAFVPKKP